MLIFLGIAVFGIFTGIGLIRLRNWARISILIFSGLTVFFGGTALLVLLAIPFPINPSGPPVDPGAVKSCRASGVWHSGSHQHLVARAVQLERNEGAVCRDFIGNLAWDSVRAGLPPARSDHCCLFPFLCSMDAGRAVPANAISGRLFRASVLRDKRESFDRARWPSIRRWINRSAEIKEMELSPGSRDPGVLAAAP